MIVLNLVLVIIKVMILLPNNNHITSVDKEK